MNLFGLYVPGRSLFHRLGAGPKYLIMILLTVPAAVLRDWRLGLACLVAAMGLLAACRIGLARAWRLPAMVWVLVAMLLGYHLLSGTPGRGVNAAAVFLVAIYVSRLLTSTTPGGELIDAQRFGVLAFNALQYPAYLAKVRLAADQRHQRAAARPGQHVVQHLTNNLFAENTSVQRAFHHVQQALSGAEDLLRQRRRVDAAFRHRGAKQWVFANVHQQRLKLKQIDIKPQTGQRRIFSRKSFTFEG